MESKAQEAETEVNKLLPCDLVMQGGITSGVVYPGAVIELSKSYHCVNVGGASAGAIAAATAAAASQRGGTRRARAGRISNSSRDVG